MRAEVIAERLRGQAETWRGYLPDDTLWDMSDHQFTESVLMAFGLDDMDMHVHEAFDKLADLIDRPTCAIVESYMGDNLESVEETPHHVLSCGHIAYGEDDPMFCPVCGAAVTDDYR